MIVDNDMTERICILSLQGRTSVALATSERYPSPAQKEGCLMGQAQHSGIGITVT